MAREAVVLGGGGLTGRCAVRDLVRGGKFSRVRVADLDRPLAEAAARKTGSSSAVPMTVDVRDAGSLGRALEGAAVCVNAVQYAFHPPIMDGCLAHRVPYLDFGGLFHMTRRQLERDAEFRRAGLLAIPGMGQVPGVSNVLAYAAAQAFDSLDAIVIRDGWRDLTVNGPEFLFTWSPSTFLDEMEKPAVIFEHGMYREVPPMSGRETFDFGEPVGPTTVYRTLHSEAATLPESLKEKGIQHVEWKEGGPGIDVLRTLAALGLGSSEPVDLGGGRVAPRDVLLAVLKRGGLLGVPEGVAINDWEIADIELSGTIHGKPAVRHAVARFPPKPEWGLAATEYAVGVAGAIAAELIVEGAVPGAGVLPPEKCIPAARLREELAARGIDTRIVPPEPPLPPFQRTEPSLK